MVPENIEKNMYLRRRQGKIEKNMYLRRRQGKNTPL